MLRLEIVRACEDDLPEILALQRLAFYDNSIRYGDPNMPPMPQTLDELRAESKGKVFLKAIENGKIVGTIRGHMDGEICRVSKVMVLPDHQNRGIAHKLLDAIEDEFRVRVFELKTGYLDDKNIHLYKKVGYVLTGEKFWETETLCFVRMRKEKNSPP
ncbi:GNAT family N-acetyltransferase [Candidatus Methanoplasma termitum]|uniref:GNAT family N-acetyltransferase n=1 Tax=Candidatus Methanoplasma termitum TaxID=1577791 RepID=UPI0011DE0EDD|nr:GNAT family N-acetyltransferase [Candidatus Methanoplasma termitum]